MAEIFQYTNIAADETAISVADGQALFIAKNVSVGSSADPTVSASGSSYITDDGSIYSVDIGIDCEVASTSMQINVDYDGSIVSSDVGIKTISTLLLYNKGAIGGEGSTAIEAKASSIVNDGLIYGETAYSGGSGADTIVNNGEMIGAVFLSSAFSTFDSSQGTVQGAITAGSGGASIIAGRNGGYVIGGSGNDSIQANRSQIAADNHVSFDLSGKGGTNALYGGGAFNTFMAGNSAGGHNQIHGGASLMSDVTGYTNNTLSFGPTPPTQSVYVDLLNGHDAYLYANANHSGALTFEDSIQNVPNVIGSAGGDLIRADNGTDVIQGGAGGDILYAGTGFDTFVYKGYADSNTPSGYDVIAGFATGKDKIDLSALNSDASHLAISSGSNSTVLYLEATPGKFTASTDLAISFQGANAIKAADVIF